MRNGIKRKIKTEKEIEKLILDGLEVAFTTTAVSKKTGLDRKVVAFYLDKMHKEGKLRLFAPGKKIKFYSKLS